MIYSLVWEQVPHEAIEFFTIGFSVRLSDRSLYREEQKKSSNIAPSDLKSGSLNHEANALPTELGRNLLGRTFRR